MDMFQKILHFVMDLEKYLLRICYAAPIESTLDALQLLHSCHLLSVPFESLTLHSGSRVILDLKLLYHKIVNQHRGGFCYENNGLFSWLLSKIGFDVTLLSGQVRNSSTCRYGPPFDHLILIVSLEGQKWLCDVGFGAWGFQFPLSLDTCKPQKQGRRVYRIRKDQDLHFLEWQGDVGRVESGVWTEVYKFTLEPRKLEDFAQMCDYHQSSPSSIFFCKSLCSILKADGRVTYIGHKLTTTTFPSAGTYREVKTTTRELKDEEIPDVLRSEFGVVLDSPLIPKDETITPPKFMY